uniref:Golgin subfamily A member 1 n=1 Tax=Neogobius melanostomus TaxID=47308 RepID=A0A8C6WMZ2_9GOBI
MFAKLKKKIAEEAATAPRTGVRIPRTISKESITSVGADSGDDFASDGSSSRDDLPAQLLRRNDQIRRLEAKLSASIKKLQDQNETHVASRAKMAEGMTLALEKKDQEWMEKLEAVEMEKAALSAQLNEMSEQSLALFQKRDDRDELEGFQQQELAKVKHMLLRKEEKLGQRERELQLKESEVQSMKRGLSEARERLQRLEQEHEESCRLNAELEIEREELLLFREESDKKIMDLESRCEELQAIIKQVSEDFHNSLIEEDSRNLLQKKELKMFLTFRQAALTEEEKERTLLELQKKVASLERRLQGNLSPDEHLQELLQEKSSLEQSLEDTRAQLVTARTDHADTVSSLETQVSRLSSTITELQTLLRHKDDSSRAYRERTDSQISSLEQQLSESNERLKSAQQQITEREQCTEKLVSATWKNCQENRSLEPLSKLLKPFLIIIEQLFCLQADVSGQHKICTEITKALEDTRRQKEELQARVSNLSLCFLSNNSKTLKVQTGQESLQQLREESENHRAEFQQKQAEKDNELETLKEELLSQTRQLDSCQARMSFLEVEVETLTEQQQQQPEVCEEEQNGSVTVDDLDHIQKVNRDLEQQLSEKNRTIKQLQQRLAELKRTLQKELKLKPEGEPDVKEKTTETRAERTEQISPDPAPASMPSPPSSNTTVTNTSDLNDSREINFEYLKHVILKFMSCREAEAFHLIRAVSVLLNFTREEEDLLKQTLEYKMSWFGSKPSPKGIIRPSISGSSTHWS